MELVRDHYAIFLMKRTLSSLSLHINPEAPSDRLVAPSHRLECTELHYSHHKRVEFDLLLVKGLFFLTLSSSLSFYVDRDFFVGHGRIREETKLYLHAVTSREQVEEQGYDLDKNISVIHLFTFGT